MIPPSCHKLLSGKCLLVTLSFLQENIVCILEGQACRWHIDRPDPSHQDWYLGTFLDFISCKTLIGLCAYSVSQVIQRIGHKQLEYIGVRLLYSHGEA